MLSIIILSCKNESKISKIEIIKSDLNFIVTTNPIDEITLLWKNNDTIYSNERDEFVISKKIEKPYFSTITIENTQLKTIILPNKNIQINYLDSTYVFKGENAKGMELLNSFKRPFFNINEMQKFNKDTTAQQIKEKIINLKQRELTQLQSLINSNSIDLSFGVLIKTEIDYFYALKINKIILSKQYQKIPIKKELLSLLNKNIEQYPLDIKYKPSHWAQYANTVLIEKPLYDLQEKGEINKLKIQELRLEDKLHRFKYDLIQEYNDLETIEKISAFYINFASIQNKFEKSLIGIYSDFTNKYPKSNYSDYLKPDIDKIKNYHIIIAKEMPKTVQFINGKDINSLNDLIKELKIEKYYVDIWATWCGPCKNEFKYNKELEKLLKSKGYKKLYISIDRKEVIQKWKDNIKYYNLEGLHLLANKQFVKSFTKDYAIYKGYLRIPQYLLINENGELVTNNAPRPSSISELKYILEK